MSRFLTRKSVHVRAHARPAALLLFGQELQETRIRYSSSKHTHIRWEIRSFMSGVERWVAVDLCSRFHQRANEELLSGGMPSFRPKLSVCGLFNNRVRLPRDSPPTLLTCFLK